MKFNVEVTIHLQLFEFFRFRDFYPTCLIRLPFHMVQTLIKEVRGQFHSCCVVRGVNGALIELEEFCT